MSSWPQSYAEEPGSASLQDLAGVLRRRWPLILALVAICALAPAMRAAVTDPTYEASSRVLFGAESLASTAGGLERDAGDPERRAATTVLLASSEAVADRVRQRLRLETATSDLLDQVDVEAEANANVLRITASDSEPRAAARLADAFAEEFVALQAQSDERSVQAAENELRRQLQDLPPDAPERAALTESLSRLITLRAVAGGDSRIIGGAVVPQESASLSPLRAGIIGALVGLALGLALAFLIEALDRRVKSIEEFERAYRLRALTVVPRRHFRQRDATARGRDLEPFRILRNALEFAAVAGDVGVLVTSAVPGEGKTTVAVDLAHAIALSGRRVVLIELDLRRPTFAQHFGLQGGDGVTTALLGRRSAVELLHQPLADAPDLWVLPAGPLPPNPAELLESAALDAVLKDLADEDVTLVLDAPPLVPVADAQVLLRQSHVDTALVVGRIGLTTRDQIRRARAILDRQRFEPLGLVVTGHHEDKRYSYDAYSPSEEPTARRRSGAEAARTGSTR